MSFYLILDLIWSAYKNIEHPDYHWVPGAPSPMLDWKSAYKTNNADHSLESKDKAHYNNVNCQYDRGWVRLCVTKPFRTNLGKIL